MHAQGTSTAAGLRTEPAHLALGAGDVVVVAGRGAVRAVEAARAVAVADAADVDNSAVGVVLGVVFAGAVLRPGWGSMSPSPSRAAHNYGRQRRHLRAVIGRVCVAHAAAVLGRGAVRHAGAVEAACALAAADAWRGADLSDRNVAELPSSALASMACGADYTLAATANEQCHGGRAVPRRTRRAGMRTADVLEREVIAPAVAGVGVRALVGRRGVHLSWGVGACHSWPRVALAA